MVNNIHISLVVMYLYVEDLTSLGKSSTICQSRDDKVYWIVTTSSSDLILSGRTVLTKILSIMSNDIITVMMVRLLESLLYSEYWYESDWIWSLNL